MVAAPTAASRSTQRRLAEGPAVLRCGEREKAGHREGWALKGPGQPAPRPTGGRRTDIDRRAERGQVVGSPSAEARPGTAVRRRVAGDEPSSSGSYALKDRVRECKHIPG